MGWDRKRWGQSEHRRLIDVTRKAMKKGVGEGDIWFTACHTGHAQPMLEAAGPAILKALVAALECATSESANRAVDSFKIGIELAALLGCDSLCHQMVGALTNAIGLQSQEALIRASESIQFSHYVLQYCCCTKRVTLSCFCFPRSALPSLGTPNFGVYCQQRKCRTIGQQLDNHFENHLIS